MKIRIRSFLPLLLLFAFLFASTILASKSTPVIACPGQDCPTACGQKRDTTLTRCARFAGDRKTNCEATANSDYDKCVQGCGSGGQNIEGTGKP